MVMTTNGSYEASTKNGLTKSQTDILSLSLFRKYQKSKSDKIRNQIAENYIPFVNDLTSRFFQERGGVIEHNDVLQNGLVELLEIIPRFDPGRGTKFSTFLYHRIRGSINDSLRKIDWVPRTARRRNKILNKTFYILKSRKSGPVSEKDMIFELKVSKDEYGLMKRDGELKRILSLDKIMNNNYNPHTMEEEDTRTPAPLEEAERKDFWEYITRGFSRREIAIIKSLYIRESTMKGTASLIRLSESRISQINSSILRRLKAREVLEVF